MRTFDLHAVLLHEDFEGFVDLDELLESWTETGDATASLEQDPYSAGGEGQHLAFTFAGAGGAQLAQDGSGLGIWMPQTGATSHTMTLSMRYKLDATLSGATCTVSIGNSAFSGAVSGSTADGEWHTATATWNVQEDSSQATGFKFIVTDAPAAGVARFAWARVVRNAALSRGSTLPSATATMRWNGEGGWREEWGYRTNVLTGRDGSETRSCLRLLPSCRVTYETRAAEPADAAWLDGWLRANHGTRVSVPRWIDAVTFLSATTSNTVVNVSESITARWFEPVRMFMLWDSPTSYEVLQVWQVEDSLIRLDSNVNTVTGSWTAGVTKVVPLVPGRLVPEVGLARPNGSMGILPLTFDLEMAS